MQFVKSSLLIAAAAGSGLRGLGQEQRALYPSAPPPADTVQGAGLNNGSPGFPSSQDPANTPYSVYADLAKYITDEEKAKHLTSPLAKVFGPELFKMHYSKNGETPASEYYNVNHIFHNFEKLQKTVTDDTGKKFTGRFTYEMDDTLFKVRWDYDGNGMVHMALFDSDKKRISYRNFTGSLGVTAAPGFVSAP